MLFALNKVRKKLLLYPDYAYITRGAVCAFSSMKQSAREPCGGTCPDGRYGQSDG